MSAITLDSVTVSLGGKQVVRNVSAEVAAGEWIALIGPNGAGKSTLLRAVAGLLRPDSGQIALDDTPLARLGRREIARRIAFVPQSPLLPPGMLVSEYVLLGRTPHIGAFSYEGHDDLVAAERALSALDLEGFARRQLHTLSGGEQQRAVLARALAQDAPFLLLDEPTTSLDIGRQQQALELVAELREHRELTVISAMHDLTLAAQYGERLLLMSDGVLVGDGLPEEIATGALISTHYGASVRVINDEGSTIVIPVRRP